jgi:hypothetical protein
MKALVLALTLVSFSASAAMQDTATSLRDLPSSKISCFMLYGNRGKTAELTLEEDAAFAKKGLLKGSLRIATNNGTKEIAFLENLEVLIAKSLDTVDVGYFHLVEELDSASVHKMSLRASSMVRDIAPKSTSFMGTIALDFTNAIDPEARPNAACAFSK